MTIDMILEFVLAFLKMSFAILRLILFPFVTAFTLFLTGLTSWFLGFLGGVVKGLKKW